MKISSLYPKEVRVGTTFLYQNKVYSAFSISFDKRARSRMKVVVSARDLVSNEIKKITLSGTREIERAVVDKKKAHFLYRRSENEYIFASDGSYEEIIVDREKVKNILNFLSPSLEVSINFCRGNILNIELPRLIKLKVIKTIGDAGTRQKRFLLENGSEINCPDFVRDGEFIWISTDKREYVKRERKDE